MPSYNRAQLSNQQFGLVTSLHVMGPIVPNKAPGDGQAGTPDPDLDFPQACPGVEGGSLTF